MISSERTTGSEPRKARPPAIVSRRRVLVMFGCGAVVLTGSGLVAGRVLRSPQQLVADSAPPPRTVLTAAVERRVLKDTVVLRGLVGAGTTVEATPTPGDGSLAVVTGVRVKAGQTVSQGVVLLEVAGRPFVALRGAVPAYRDLRPGTHGRDVAQLQAALRSLGHNPHETDGVFGAGTKNALSEYYEAIGYDVAEAGDAQALVAAAQTVRQAERAVAEAQHEWDRLRANPPPSPGPGEPDPVAEAEQRLRFAKEDLAAARATLAELERTSGPMLPLAEFTFLPSFPARVERLTARIGARVEPPLITLSSGRLVVRARLSPAQRALVREGMPVEVASELLGVTASGTVDSIGEFEEDEGGGRSHAMIVTASGDPFTEKLAGADVRLTVEAASTEGEVLVVPLSAVFADADGRTGVLRQAPDEAQQRIVVTAGVSGDGYVAVTPVAGYTLTPGDLVVVGAGEGS